MINTKHSAAAEADRHSRIVLDAALQCLDYGNRRPILGPAMVGCALNLAGLGVVIAGLGVFAGIVEAAPAGPPGFRNTSAH